MTDDEKMLLYTRLEGYAVVTARDFVERFRLQRWRDDIEQEARVALWKAVLRYDSSRKADTERAVKNLFFGEMRNAIRRYKRWETREQQLADVYLFFLIHHANSTSR